MLFLFTLLPLLLSTAYALPSVHPRSDDQYENASLQLKATGKCLRPLHDKAGEVIEGFEFLDCLNNFEWSIFKDVKQIGFTMNTSTPVLDAGPEGENNKPGEVTMQKAAGDKHSQQWLVRPDGRIALNNETLCLSQTKGVFGEPSIRTETCGAGPDADDHKATILQVWNIYQFNETST